MQQYLEAGKVVTTHGVRGEMKLELWCDGVAFLKKVGRLYPSLNGGKCYQIKSIRAQGQMALLQLEGVDDMDAARALRGQVFYFDRNDATLPAGRWYVADLIGCEVRDADTGKVYGIVTSVDHPGAQDIYTVKSHSGKEYMFPGVDAFLKERNPPSQPLPRSVCKAVFQNESISLHVLLLPDYIPDWSNHSQFLPVSQHAPY